MEKVENSYHGERKEDPIRETDFAGLLKDILDARDYCLGIGCQFSEVRADVEHDVNRLK